MSAEQPTIIYTLTDEAPLLATYAFLPIVRTFADAAGIDIKTSDISVAARILSEFDDYLSDEQRVPDNLAELGALTQQPDTNIIKLPNISASVPQLLAAIKELKAKGYDLPEYPGEPKTDEEKEITRRYGKCLGSAVNPVLREGNSDRRAPKAVKEYARKHPHSMSAWSQASRTHVATMRTGDFYHGEKSLTLDKARRVKMVLETASGETIVLKPEVKLDDGDVIDSMFMSKGPLRLLRGADGGRLSESPHFGFGAVVESGCFEPLEHRVGPQHQCGNPAAYSDMTEGESRSPKPPDTSGPTFTSIDVKLIRWSYRATPSATRRVVPLLANRWSHDRG
jgi:monomeric type NADP-dependent isocitrate dehydrogenase